MNGKDRYIAYNKLHSSHIEAKYGRAEVGQKQEILRLEASKVEALGTSSAPPPLLHMSKTPVDVQGRHSNVSRLGYHSFLGMQLKKVNLAYFACQKVGVTLVLIYYLRAKKKKHSCLSSCRQSSQLSYYYMGDAPEKLPYPSSCMAIRAKCDLSNTQQPTLLPLRDDRPQASDPSKANQKYLKTHRPNYPWTRLADSASC